MTTKQPSFRSGLPSFCVFTAAVLLAVCGAAFHVNRAPNAPAGQNSGRDHSLGFSSAASVGGASATTSAASQHRALTTYGDRPLAFEVNQGQSDPQVKFLARGRGYTLFLTSKEAVFALPIKSQESALTELASGKRFGSAPLTQTRGSQNAPQSGKPSLSVLRMRMLGANPEAQIAVEDELAGKTNYLIGQDPKNWRTNVPQYARVRYQEVYPGVDVAFHGARQLEFDFIVKPGANPKQIELGFRGAQQVRTEKSGDLVLTSAAGKMRLLQPVAYQEKDGTRQPVGARFAMKGKNQVAFVLGPYDHTLQLVIDPLVAYSTYLGGDGEDEGYGITLDGSGNAYVVGADGSHSFPGGSGSVIGGGGGLDCFLAQLTPSGALGFTTIFGGSGDDIPWSVQVDSQGIYVAGVTYSSNFPVSSGAVQNSYAGSGDGFLAKLALNGSSITWATYVGGNNSDIAFSTTVDSNHNVFVAGRTFSANLLVNNFLPQGGALNSASLSDGFVAEIKSDGSAYLIMSYIGGNSTDAATGIALNAATGNVYVTGFTLSPNLPVTQGVFQPTCGTDGTCNLNNGQASPDAFVASFNPSNTASYAYFTYLGGEKHDVAEDLAVDSSGNAYVAGFTNSSLFPVHDPYQGTLGTNASANAFVTKLNPTGTALVYSTYLGGGGQDLGLAIALDAKDNAYITGSTSSSNFPLHNATQGTFGGGTVTGDAFVSELSWNGTTLTLPFSTYLGGSGDEDVLAGFLATDSLGNIYVTGDTNSSDFLTRSALDGTLNGGVQSQCTIGGNSVTCPDAFVTRFSATTTVALGAQADYFGEGKADFTVWRPSSGTFYSFDGSTHSLSHQLGVSADIPVIGDYDGDGKTDLAVWRPSTGVWYVLQSSTGKVVQRQWGRNGDVPVPGDYDGDGKTDFAVWRPSTGVWYILQSSTGRLVQRQWGLSKDVPVPGDYDGDGKTDFAVWRPSTAVWYVIQSTTGKVVTKQWGLPKDVPVPGDYDGDGKTDFAVWRPSTAIWYVIQSSSGKDVARQWGRSGDVPVSRDYDGDGKTDFAVWRPSNGTWYALESSNGHLIQHQWGLNGDIPVNRPVGQ